MDLAEIVTSVREGRIDLIEQVEAEVKQKLAILSQNATAPDYLLNGLIEKYGNELDKVKLTEVSVHSEMIDNYCGNAADWIHFAAPLAVEGYRQLERIVQISGLTVIRDKKRLFRAAIPDPDADAKLSLKTQMVYAERALDTLQKQQGLAHTDMYFTVVHANLTSLAQRLKLVAFNLNNLGRPDLARQANMLNAYINQTVRIFMPGIYKS
ncbi:MAG: hypothetical protein KJ601_04265 [Nanoarchaeota archaeon]|nr:hypothetical protein [Nanoarchaeota archaeon]MBU1704999.1 hypothetical protein [Nanoarchaeota archaeon]